jgi:hypothetical protein
MFGNVDSTYTLATWMMAIGGFGFLLGVGLLIGGLARKRA